MITSLYYKIINLHFICRQFEPKHKKLMIDFDEIDWNNMTQLPTSPKPDLEII